MLAKAIALAAAAIFLSLANLAHAADWTFEIVNETKLRVDGIRTQMNGKWSENWIKERIEPGDAIDMNFGNEVSGCMVQTQIRFSDGSRFDASADYCKIRALHIHKNRLTSDKVSGG